MRITYDQNADALRIELRLATAAKPSQRINDDISISLDEHGAPRLHPPFPRF